MRKVLLTVILLLAGTTIGVSKAACEDEGKLLSAGALLPVTGGYAPYGTLVWEGIQLRSEGEVQWLVEDTGTMNAKDALSAARSLVARDKLAFVINFAVDDAEWLAPFFNKAKIPLVTAWDSNRRFDALGDFSFSVGYDTDTAGQKLARHAVEQGKAKRFAIIAEDSPYNRTVSDAFTKQAAELGAAVVYEDWYALGTRDFRASFMKIRPKNIQALYFLPSLPESLDAGLKQLRQLKIEIPLYSNELLVPDPSLAASRGPLRGCASWIPPAPPDVLSRYRAKYGKEPWNHGPLMVGYEAADTVLRALRSATITTSSVEALQAFIGPSRRTSKAFEVFCWQAGELQKAS